ncbi:MAG: hypothetical protein JNK82_08015 [Myxococcaceae bacterium]|nr:hypothetical protein [Myxococcaceae bacterium]
MRAARGLAVLLVACSPPSGPTNDAGVHDAGVHDAGVHDAGAADAGAPKAAQLAVELDRLCVRFDDGSVSCWCPAASQTFGSLVASDAGILHLAASAYGGLCAVHRGGEVSCAAGVSATCARPLQRVAGVAGAAEVSVGGRHACARLVDGGVRCWGDDGAGQLGHDAGLGLSAVRQVAAAEAHTCALLEGGTVWCWGRTELYDGTSVVGPTPMPFGGLAGVARVAGGVRGEGSTDEGGYGCVCFGDGGVACWGDNWMGRSGNATDQPHAAPISSLTSGVELALGHHSCAVQLDAGVECWGYNASGQLGSGEVSIRSTIPVAVVDLPAVIEVAVGGYASCARTAGGDVYCWGAPFGGTLPDGGLSARPTRVWPRP